MFNNFLNARWEQLIMANYAVEPPVLKPYLPYGTELDFFDGKTYVSLVGFLFKSIRIFGVPVPVFGTFEEINLRFYVRRKGEQQNRGVVFINETVPHQAVAWLANLLYKEHYTAIPTRHQWRTALGQKRIGYQWKMSDKWNHIKVEAKTEQRIMEPGGIEQFIFEHYYGYTKVGKDGTEEYQVKHPSWMTNEVTGYDICCDFGTSYGTAFNFLDHCQPDSVLLAEGSEVSIKWKRERL